MTNSLFPVAEGDTTDLANVEDLADALIAVGSVSDSSQSNYLKFTKTGQWVFGREDDEVDPDETIAVNPTSFTIGWQGWEDGMPQDGPVVPMPKRTTLPSQAELPPLKDGDMNGWNKMLGVSLQTLSDGTPLQYNATSYGGKQAISKLMKEVGLGLKGHPEAPVALVKLSGDSYKHAKYGTIHSPMITIVGWADGNGKEVKKLASAA